MRLKNTSIIGLYTYEMESIGEEDLTYETYNMNFFKRNDVNCNFVQDNQVFSKRDVIRGMHVNLSLPQYKLVRVISGKILDVVVDLRRESDTFLSYFVTELSAETKNGLLIPERMGHGYLAMEEPIIEFKVTSYYKANSEIGFAWNSKHIVDVWPIDTPILSTRDKSSEKLENLIGHVI